MSAGASISASDDTDEPVQFLLLGDSLTQLGWQGWAAHLANVYQRRADVINRGCSGYNTDFYLHMSLPVLSRVRFVTIWFGANDAALGDINPHHHVPLARYRANLEELIRRVRIQYKTVKILLLTPPPLDHAQRLVYQKERYGADATGVLERTTETTQQYAQACMELAENMNIPCVDIFQAMLTQPDYGRFLSDGLHFSAAGHAFVGDMVVNAIDKHFRLELGVTPCRNTLQYNNSSSVSPIRSWGPYHDEIDHANVPAAFDTKKQSQKTRT